MNVLQITTTFNLAAVVEDKCPPNLLYLQMSSYHCRHHQNWTNVLQTLPPKANVLQITTTTAAFGSSGHFTTENGQLYSKYLTTCR